jgi:hypothetical protein
LDEASRLSFFVAEKHCPCLDRFDDYERLVDHIAPVEHPRTVSFIRTLTTPPSSVTP